MFKRIFKSAFAKSKEDADTSDAKVAELREQLRLTAIATHFEIDRQQAEPYFRMRDEFAALSGCSAIWGLVRERSVDQYRERTTADAAVDRKPVSLSVDTCDLIQWEQGVPHFKNGNGGDIYLYPGFIIYRAAKGAFSLISSHDLQVHAVMVDFHEEWAIPSDSRTVGYDWAKQNKDGSRDRRFVNNYQIPVVQYGRLSLKSDTGLWEEFLFSAPERLKNFVNVWAAFESSFDDARASA